MKTKIISFTCIICLLCCFSFALTACQSEQTPGVVDAEKLSVLPAAGATDDAYMIRLEKNVPQRIRMFVWLEGQDVDCASSAFADSLVLGLELAGGSN